MSLFSGRCMCGSVTVTAKPEPASLSACHCDMCRRWTSGALIVLQAGAGSVKFDGPVRRFQSSDWAERAFCGECGSNLWYRVTAPGPMHGQYHLSAGLFDLNGMQLGLEVFIDKKPDAYGFAGERRRMTGQEVFEMFAPKDSG